LGKGSRRQAIFGATIQKDKSKGQMGIADICDVFEKVKNISQALLNRNLSADRPVVVLSENSIEHALIALACCMWEFHFRLWRPHTQLRSIAVRQA
jgi:acyl-CoA synthetase (AMP-forming)/AMP-acid ligase II